MTKKQKKAFRGLKGEKKKLKFIAKLVAQQRAIGRHDYWRRVYLRKCAKQGVKPLLRCLDMAGKRHGVSGPISPTPAQQSSGVAKVLYLLFTTVYVRRPNRSSPASAGSSLKTSGAKTKETP